MAVQRALTWPTLFPSAPGLVLPRPGALVFELLRLLLSMSFGVGQPLQELRIFVALEKVFALQILFVLDATHLLESLRALRLRSPPWSGPTET